MRTTTLKLLPAVIALGVAHTTAEPQFLGPRQVNELPASAADHRIQYGSSNLQFGDLRLPKMGNGRLLPLLFTEGAGRRNMEISSLT
jgi:hypothetical protein